MMRSSLFVTLLGLTALALAADQYKTLVFVGPITGPGTSASGKQWDGDLGIPFYFGGNIYFLEGDVEHQSYARIGSASGFCTPANFQAEACNTTITWYDTSSKKPYPVPFYPLVASSTVPAGAITLNGVAYIFMMNVTTFGSGLPGDVIANGFLISGTPPTSFTASSTVAFPQSGKFENSAPLYRAADGYVYIYGSGKYRAATIRLARVAPAQINNLTSWTFFNGLSSSGVPIWSNQFNVSKRIIADGGVGELSAQYNSYLGQYLVSYFDFQADGSSLLRLGVAGAPYGPFNTNTVLYNSSFAYPWYGNSSWCCPYGGYMVPDNGVASKWLYFTVSLFTPYRAFLLKLDLSTLSAPVPTTYGFDVNAPDIYA